MSENNKSIIHQNANVTAGSATTATAAAAETTKSDKSGWLLKWTNYLKGSFDAGSKRSTYYMTSFSFLLILGYQKRWFVLSNGVLSYYR
jgi:hypothetical protein